MGYEGVIARRHLRSMRRRKRVAFTAAVAVIGVGLGVATLVIVLSVMNGYSGMIWDRQVGMNPHITVRRPYSQRIGAYEPVLKLLAAHPEVTGVSPFVKSEGFVLGHSGVKSGVVVRGVDPESLRRTSDIGDHLTHGKMDLSLLEADGRRRAYGMVIGRSLADKLGVGVGDDIRLVVAPKELLMTQMPPFRRYVVTGIFDTGYYEFDSGLVFVSLLAAQRDLGWQNLVTGLYLRLKDPFEADRVSLELREVLSQTYPRLFPTSWMYLHGNLYAWIWLQKWASFVVLSLIVVVAGFNIISILTMNVTERRREIGILMSMGATPRSIGKIFTQEGLIIGACGVCLGDVLGFTLCWIQQRYEPIQLSGEVYFIDALPVAMSAFDFVLISICAVVLCYLFTLLPARNAALLNPVDAIRYE